MRLRLKCSACGGMSEDLKFGAPAPSDGTVSCRNGHRLAYRLSESLRAGEWDACPSCGSREVYSRKDVPRRLLLGILAVSLAAAFFLLGWNWYAGMALLAGLALLDFALYQLLPDLLVCYRCGTEAREFRGLPWQGPYDPHVGEKHRRKRGA